MEALVILIMPCAVASCVLHMHPVSEHELHHVQLAYSMCKMLQTTAISDHADFHLWLPKLGMAHSTCAP